MRKILFSLFATSISINLFAQAWVWDEIAQETEESDPITFFHILIFAIFCAIIWFGIQAYKYLKSLKKAKYLKIRKITIIVCSVLMILFPFTILTFFDLKREFLESEAKQTLNQIIINAGSYIEIRDGEYASFSEIQPRDNQSPNNQISIDWMYKLFLEQGVTPYDGVIRCYNIYTSGFQVIFAGDARIKGFSSEESPSLFHGWVRPFRIRYYSSNKINPNRDLGNVYRDFIQSFIWNHNAQLRDDITDDFFHRSLNEYYEISHIPSGDEMWADNKLYDENDIVQERSYEYKTINYGMYDITYCISRPCKLGVCEKYVHGRIFGKEIFDQIHFVKRNEALTKYCSIWVVFLGVITAIFFFGNPSRNQN